MVRPFHLGTSADCEGGVSGPRRGVSAADSAEVAERDQNNDTNGGQAPPRPKVSGTL